MRKRKIINGVILSITLLLLLAMCSMVVNDDTENPTSVPLSPTPTYTYTPEPEPEQTTTADADLPNVPHVDVDRPKICHRKWWC